MPLPFFAVLCPLEVPLCVRTSATAGTKRAGGAPTGRWWNFWLSGGMADAIASYELEYKGHIAAAEIKIEQAERADREDDRRAAAASGDRAIEAAKDVVQLMELEGRGLPAQARSDLQSRLRACRSSIGELKARLKEARNAGTPQRNGDRIREELFAGHSPGPNREERESMLSSSNRIASGTERIKGVHSTVREMEETGASIMNDLHSQRETLLKTKSTLAHASEGLESSRRLVRSMARRAAGNKLVMYLVIFLIGAIIIFVLWKQVGGGAAAEAPVAAAQADSDEWKVTAKP